uniref:Uncharacterized protein n=1 Tax=Anguilla anguilla TaxID=7936 RepID=A0A0E9W2V1_ANGAN
MVVIGNTGVLTAQYREPEQAETNCHCAFYFTLHVTCLAVTWPPALFRLCTCLKVLLVITKHRGFKLCF